MLNTTDFSVVAYERGSENPRIATWANDSVDPVGLAAGAGQAVTRAAVPDVPGAFILHDVLSFEECRRFIDLTEALGYLSDAAVSLPRSVRHNDNVTWVVDARTDGLLRARCAAMVGPEGVWQARGINARFRFYRYGPGDYFRAHTDGAWPGSRVIERRLIPNAMPDRYSRLTFLLLLSDHFEGGETRFWIDQNTTADVRIPAGSVLCFPHGTHPDHCLHASQSVRSGIKYMMRSDVLFDL